jgi:Tol biopolymer transport system component
MNALAFAHTDNLLFTNMAIKSLVVLLVASTLIGCSDKIDVSNADGNTEVNGAIILNRCTEEATHPCNMLVIDFEGSTKRELRRGMVVATAKGRIIYMDSNFVYSCKNDGSDIRTLIASPASNATLRPPIVSEDGSTLAYLTVGNFDGTKFETTLHVANVDGTNDVVISNEPDFETLPSLSPDGKRIAFFRNINDNGTGGECELIVANGNGSEPKVIRQGIVVSGTKWHYTSAAWSPTGDKIAYSSSVGDGYSISIIKPDGTQNAVIGEGFDPVWSPNGKSLVWSNKLTAKLMLSTDLGLSSSQLTTSSVLAEGFPRFSSDGKKILFTMWENPDDDPTMGKLMVIDIATKVTKEVANTVYDGFWLN